MKKTGQSMIEYALIVAVVVSALITMQVYMKRAVQGRFRGQMANISDGFYSPKETIGILVSTSDVVENRSSIQRPGIFFSSSDVQYSTVNATTDETTRANERVLSP